MNTLRALPGTGSPTPDHAGGLPAGDVVFHTPAGTHRVPGWDTLGGRDLGTFDTLGGPDLGTYDTLGGPDLGTYDTLGGPDLGTYDTLGGPDLGDAGTVVPGATATSTITNQGVRPWI
jgi:hypothetical protein